MCRDRPLLPVSFERSGNSPESQAVVDFACRRSRAVGQPDHLLRVMDATLLQGLMPPSAHAAISSGGPGYESRALPGATVVNVFAGWDRRAAIDRPARGWCWSRQD
ncbi:hypothetical protein D3872_09900 [Massilia cavernae]|uniref:Uncharacterized protein n=1 Tax=Massilia cavernae TaxID=2320864 RepID=A0A418XY06_9BURK|nr:hypothetical protein D3872_09900 [Massilia cavernae]